MRGERGEERGVDGREKGKGGLLALASKNDMYMYILAGSLYQYIFKREMRRKEKRSKQGNTEHPRQSLSLRKMNCLGWDSNPLTCTCTCTLHKMQH